MSAMDSFQDGIDTLRSAVIDGRTENVRHRQNELLKLHSGLSGKSSSICDAVSKDSGVSASDAEKEFVLAMDAVQKIYETLDFERSLEDEYLVKEGKDHLSRRVGVGIVAIRPTDHTRLYSIVSPLAAAIAAGNCVLLELEHTDSQLDQALMEILPSVLDRDTFFASHTRLKNEQVSQIDLTVDQMSTASVSNSNQLLSRPEARTLAVVDRTANIGLAAREIATARLSPYNTSPYSPDLVIVNTFVVAEFVERCMEYADSIASSGQKSLPDGNLHGVEKRSAEGELVVHTSKTGNLKVIVLQARSPKPPTTKSAGQYLFVRPSTSTTDAIFSQSSSPPYLATYNFATPSLTKHLSQSLPSHASFSNHIPLPLLYGPAAPSPAIYPVGVHPRYTPDMFSAPRPEFVTKVGLPAEMRALRPTGQKEGHAVGFFEQGIFIGLGLTASLVVPVVGWGVWRLGREGWKVVGEWR